MISKEQYWMRGGMKGNLEFWRAYAKRDPQCIPDDFTRRILAEDIEAAQHFGDREAENELIAVDLDKLGTGDPEARASAYNAERARRAARTG